jgi:hypothetical protein
MKHQIKIELSDEDYDALERLAQNTYAVPPDGFRPPVVRVLEYAACSLAAGVRRPGSWEATAVAALFGE